LVHIRQNSDSNSSDWYFNDIDFPKLDLYLKIGSASHSLNTLEMTEQLEPVILRERPDVVLVVGDSDLTVACSLLTKKIRYRGNHKEDLIPKLAHIEAGLRSFDRSTPEEINRVVTNPISDYLFTTEKNASHNLLYQGVPNAKVFFVGNVLIDTFMRHRPMAEESSILQDMQLADGERVRPYGILTLHKPANIRDNRILSPILNTFIQISKRMPILFPAHPEMFEWLQDKYLSDYLVDHFICNPEPWDGRMRLRADSAAWLCGFYSSDV
jgi:UDP-N-acetylglucosamine 2-epimerase (non-hydrolysing)